MIDIRSYTTVISQEVVKKLGLEVKPHPEPYVVALITNTKLRVSQRCLVWQVNKEFLGDTTCFLFF